MEVAQVDVGAPGGQCHRIAGVVDAAEHDRRLAEIVDLRQKREARVDVDVQLTVAQSRPELRAGAEVHAEVELAPGLRQLVGGDAVLAQEHVLQVALDAGYGLEEETLPDVQRLMEVRLQETLLADLQRAVPLAAAPVQPRSEEHTSEL